MTPEASGTWAEAIFAGAGFLALLVGGLMRAAALANRLEAVAKRVDEHEVELRSFSELKTHIAVMGERVENTMHRTRNIEASIKTLERIAIESRYTTAGKDQPPGPPAST